MDKNRSKTPQGERRQLAEFARRALEAWRSDATAEYEQLVKTYEGCSAVVGVFGLGSITVTVSGGVAQVHEEAPDRQPKVIGRGAAFPETIVALSEGRITPIEAFHAGDLVVRADSEELHRAYGLMVKMTDSAVRSKRLQSVLKDFRAMAQTEPGRDNPGRTTTY